MSVMDRFRLDDRVAIVTGASSGLGVTIAQALAEAGADVVLGARRIDRLRKTVTLVEQTGRRGIAIQADVSNPEDCERLAAAAHDEFGRLDILINNAGIGKPVTALKQSPDDFRKVIDVNLLGAHWMSCAAARTMEGKGAIVNVASMMALVTGGTPQAGYIASKAGMLGLTRDLAQEWTARRGIRVNAVAPGYFHTELTAEYGEAMNASALRTMTQRVGEPEELAAAIVFLASDASSYVTGETLLVDGGFVVG